MFAGFRAALHRQACGLIKRQHFVIFIEHEALDIGDIAIRQLTLFRLWPRKGQGRHADLLTRHHSILRLGARAVNADLARAGETLNLNMGQVRPSAFKPTVKAHSVLTRADIEKPDLARLAAFAHASTLRVRKSPSISAKIDNTTDPST